MGVVSVCDGQGVDCNVSHALHINEAVKGAVGLRVEGGDTHADIAGRQVCLLDLSGGIAVGLAGDGKFRTGSIYTCAAEVCLVDRIILGNCHVDSRADEIQAYAAFHDAADFCQSAFVLPVIQQCLHIHHCITDCNAIHVSPVFCGQMGHGGVGGDACCIRGKFGRIGPGMGNGSAASLNGDGFGFDGTGAGDGGFAGGGCVCNCHIGAEAAKRYRAACAGSQVCIGICGVDRFDQNVLCLNPAALRQIENGAEFILGIGSIDHNACRNCCSGHIAGFGQNIADAIAANLHITVAGNGHRSGRCVGDALAAAIGHSHVGCCRNQTAAADVKLCPGRCLISICIQIGDDIQTGCLDVAAGDLCLLGAA